MSIQLRQIALVAEFLKPIIEDLTYILGVKPCFIDEGVGIWGLANTLLSIGHNFLEVRRLATAATNEFGLDGPPGVINERVGSCRASQAGNQRNIEARHCLT